MTEQSRPAPTPEPAEPAAASAIATPAVTAEVAPAAKPRVALWDNARFGLIALVVIGHAIQPIAASSDLAMGLYLAIYAFHMPAFILISGYFSKAEPMDARAIRRLIQDILVPYLIFETLWSVIRSITTGVFTINYATASWTLWFLLALFLMRLALPIIAQLRWPLLLSLAFSLTLGWFDTIDSTFAISRTIALLPLFVLGWKLRGTDLAAWWLALSGGALAVWRGVAALVLGGFAVASFVWVDLWRELGLKDWYFYDDPGADLASYGWWVPGRLGSLLLAILLTAAFLALIPRRRTPVTELGAATMTVYLLHTLVLFGFRESGFLAHLPATWLSLLAVVLAAIAITVVLASRPVRWLARPLAEPSVPWLFRRDETDAPPAR